VRGFILSAGSSLRSEKGYVYIVDRKSDDFVDDFPRTAIGKVQKSVLRKKYRDGTNDRLHPAAAAT
jgi:acyl-CoA synthetase (AMP-forming)/AMP-acid ligase II